ncbi:DNA-binding transcriptional regulator SgrR of sgrS sRNA, contains a MarR-type HTH domain and a solute-binding domain [Paenibacillaceae bacterium GAS479]|nr:DNA-binding transcriptional regulator SgrR of sgrS sRNA, contains a MarR-type HTH domain and a solute-binding domain [Paenibacillaceae bacterium GAS479]
MYANERYLTLLNRFSGDSELGSSVEATLEDIAAALYCTPRNAKLILRRLQQEELIAWHPGRGRGHRSRISFLAPMEEYLMKLLQEAATAGNYRAAFELLGEYTGGTDVRERFLGWLDGQFGYKKEQKTDSAAHDRLRFPILNKVNTLDPAKVNFALDAHLLRQLFDRLLRYCEEEQRIVPAAAHHWSVNAEGTVWTFFLRKGIQFHDGRELSSRDVVFTFQRLRGETANRWLTRGVQDIQAIGSHVVRFQLSKPNYIFERFVCSTAASLLPDGFGGRAEEEFWKKPIGTGPFRLLCNNSCRIELSAHELYYGGRPYLDYVDMIIIPEECQPLMESEPGMMRIRDGFYYDPKTSPDTLPPSDDWQSIQKLCHGCAMMGWNLRKPGPQQSEAFRRAVRMILDPADLVEHLAEKNAFPAYGFLPETSAMRTSEPLRPERLRSALREAEYDGTPIHVVVDPKYRDEITWMQKRLAEWGIVLEIEYVVQGCGITFRDSDLAIWRIVIAEDEVCEIEAYEHEECLLHNYLEDDTHEWIIGRIDAALASPDAAARRQILRQVEEQLRDDGTIIFLHHQQLSTYLHPSVQGVRLNRLGWVDFKNVWLETCLAAPELAATELRS